MAYTHAEYLQMVRAAEEAVSENIYLRQRIAELEQRLLAVELTPERAYDLGNAEVSQLAAHYHTLLTTIVDELRARRCDVAGELIAGHVRALEDQLAQAKERAWQEHARARPRAGKHAAHGRFAEARRRRQRASGARASASARGRVMSILPPWIELTPEEEAALDQMWDEIQAENEAARAARRMRSRSIGRGQRSCAGCRHVLPMAWVGELCQACQDSGRVPRPAHMRRHSHA